jgi:hypothetical protein
MSFNILPKNVIEGTNSDGKNFRAYEYDFNTFATLQMMSFFSYLLVGGFFCAIASPIILVMLMLNFTGRFNVLYLTIPVLSGYFIYDCANGWIMSLLLNFFIEADTLVLLAGIHIACIVVIAVLTIFGKVILNTINAISNDVTNRYIIFFIVVGFIFCLSMAFAFEHINVEWLGLTRIHRELGHI